MLKADAPQVRTAEELLRRHEQLLHAQDTRAVTPKEAEQFNSTLKGIRWLADLRFRYLQLLAKYGKRAPQPQDAMLRDYLALEEPPAK